jgi:hypothetical protein
MSSESLPTIELDCRPPAAARLAALLACVTVALVPLLVIPGLWNLMVSLACTAIVMTVCRRAGSLGGPRTVRQAYWSTDGQWWLKDGTGVTINARLLGDSRVFAHWIWLRWDSPLGLRQAVLLRDATQAAVVRRLAVRLRLQGTLHGAGPDTFPL